MAVASDKKKRNKKIYLLPQGFELPKKGFVRKPIVLALFQIGNSTLYKWIQEGRFLAPTKLGPRTSAWPCEYIISKIDNFSGEK